MPKPRSTAADKLNAMAATYRARNAVYSDNFIRIGNALHAMFPGGLTIDTPQDWTRLYFFMLATVKQSRYATNFRKGGHVDSVHDQAVYAAMLESYDEFIRDNHQQVGAGDSTEARNEAARKAAHGGPPKSGRR